MGPGEHTADALRALPSVDRLAADLDGPHASAVAAARTVLARRRAELLRGARDTVDVLAQARAELAAREHPSLRRVINATGVLLHTNLGRAPLAPAARAAVARAAEGYSNLEHDVAAGTRWSRHEHVRNLLRELTGAESALVVNNCAGATLLAVAALAGPGREVVVSRGQLVEIGGGFRVPEVVEQSGSTLVEVGTTNRTRGADYERAVGPATGAVLRVHPSNFRQLGFVEDVPIEELCQLGPPVIDDVGSGTLDPAGDEPPVRRSVAAGAALVCFSGDKLLGGPQAGLLVGRADAIAAAERHPLARALRIDKLSLAALEATLALHRDPQRAEREIPALAMLRAPEEELAARATRLAELTGGTVVRSVAKVGGGTLPLLDLDGPAVALGEEWAEPLRGADPPVAGRVSEGRLLLDPRTLTDEEVEWVGRAFAGLR